MPLGLTSHDDPLQDDDLPQVAENLESIPRTIRTRLILSVNGVFVITMVMFMAAAYLGEKRVHRDETYTHLDETAGVIAFTLPDPTN